MNHKIFDVDRNVKELFGSQDNALIDVVPFLKDIKDGDVVFCKVIKIIRFIIYNEKIIKK